jgi:exo-beta-1,3-glucanase (GH17 family)
MDRIEQERIFEDERLDSLTQ